MGNLLLRVAEGAGQPDRVGDVQGDIAHSGLSGRVPHEGALAVDVVHPDDDGFRVSHLVSQEARR
ncbi:hypothetical protein GCM10010145_33870 [Streptomyces ruber]|uniref:Uncharacterized protein n=2 Tax=Streptomyces TaxID=1883 RepID=A0A918BE97_9ACTN|nr:hypothetical protein GCM10010145_33870 [Streptomyces ruber]